MAQIPMGGFAQAQVTPQAQQSRLDTRSLSTGQGAASLARGIDDMGDALMGIALQNRQEAEKIAVAEAQVALQRRTNEVGAVLAEWSDEAARPGYDLEKADEDLTSRLRGLPVPEIKGLSQDRQIIFSGSIENMNADVLAKARQYKAKVYGDRAQLVFAEGQDALGAAAIDPAQDIDVLYKRADAIGIGAGQFLPQDVVGARVRQTKEAISGARVGAILAGANSVEALNELEKDLAGGRYVLDGPKVATYLGIIANNRNTIERSLEAKADKRDRTAERAVTKLQEWGSTGLPPKPEAVIDLLEKTKGTEFEADANMAAQVINLNKDYYTKPLAEAEAEVSDFKVFARRAPTSGPGFMKRAMTAASGIVAERKKLAQSYPVEAMLSDSGVRHEPLELTDGNKLTAQIEDRLDAVAAYRKQQGIAGIPDNPFTMAEQAQIAELMAKPGNEQSRIFLMGAVARASGSPPVFRQAMASVKQDSPLNYAIGELLMMAPRGGNRVAGMIYKGQQVMEAKAVPLPEPEAMRQHYAEQVGTALSPTSEEYANGFMRFQRLYAAEATADMGKEIDPDLATRAFGLATGGVVDFRGSSVVPPWGMRGNEFRAKATEAAAVAAKPYGFDASEDKLEPRPDYNGQYYLVNEDGEVRTRPATAAELKSRPDIKRYAIVVKVK